MTETTHPTWVMLQKYLQKRHITKQPPPSIAEIRKQLGWSLIPANKPQGKR